MLDQAWASVLMNALAAQGGPYQALSVPHSMWPGVGLTDVLLTAKGPYSALASAQDGHVSAYTQQLKVHGVNAYVL